MATIHGLSVVKNHCYVAPRHPKTNKPATENERPGQSLETDERESERMEEREHSSSSRRRHKSRHRKKRCSAREALSRSLQELEGVDEGKFYERLVKLRNEHKKTLKTVETLYYGELEKQRAGFQLDSKTRIALDEDDPKTAYKEYDPGDYNPFEKDSDDGDQGKENWPVASRAVDHVRDMSSREEPGTKNEGTTY